MGVQVRVDLPMPICVVAERDDVDAAREHLIRVPRGDPDAARGVLAVDDDKIDRQAFPQRREQGNERPAANSTNDISDEQNVDVIHVCATSARAYFHVNRYEAPLASTRSGLA